MKTYLVACALLVSSCGKHHGQFTCDGILPADQARYGDVAALSVGGCGGCHTTASPISGFNFEGHVTTYDAFQKGAERIYVQIESGAMPPGDVVWSDEEQRLLRSWICHGMLFEEAP